MTLIVELEVRPLGKTCSDVFLVQLVETRKSLGLFSQSYRKVLYNSSSLLFVCTRPIQGHLSLLD